MNGSQDTERELEVTGEDVTDNGILNFEQRQLKFQERENRIDADIEIAATKLGL